MRVRICLALIIFLSGVAVSVADERVRVENGEFTPLYGLEKADQKLAVKAFLIDRYPVTNADFAAFLAASPEWKSLNKKKLLSDGNLLRHWENGKDGALRPKEKDSRKPVVNVSWFAAEDYCRSKGGRLPSVIEWEYAAAASEDKRDASRDPQFVERLLGWYSKPSGGTDALQEIGKGSPNFWGIHDLHGLVWEWTADFNSVFVGGDNRSEGEKQNNLVCGVGAETAADRANYAAFMRYAMRNSLRGSYTTPNLGFRCAYDLQVNKQE